MQEEEIVGLYRFVYGEIENRLIISAFSQASKKERKENSDEISSTTTREISSFENSGLRNTLDGPVAVNLFDLSATATIAMFPRPNRPSPLSFSLHFLINFRSSKNREACIPAEDTNDRVEGRNHL